MNQKDVERAIEHTKANIAVARGILLRDDISEEHKLYAKSDIVNGEIALACMEAQMGKKSMKCECKDLKEALIHMVGQFAYEGKSECGQKIYQTGGLSALELAFETLGIEENSIYSELWSLMEDSNE